MRTLPPDAQQHRDEAIAALGAFGREVFGGGLRWHSTVFTVGGVLLLVGMYVGILPVETYWPVHTRGTTATVLIVLLFAFWALMAVLNWRSYVRRRRRA